ncbi:translation initiation factor 2 [Streptomyces iconiensis]|uniref:Translation initiation factor 2 n=1 Tax=Streptomyces iconiensis TaxID=1384038 RepID=A0ABT6ZW08_9ACTN|nr:translation initiation factor 2 [Streptomyces iconiensis]MDJ1132613.1 translation initiation factor 2 [Streptomyces iconiensis]
MNVEAGSVLFVVRTATTLHRLLDIGPALAGDRRIRPYFTLVPGSDFSADAFAALDGLGAVQVPWEEAKARSFGLVLAASAKGELHQLSGPLALLPHGAGFSKRSSQGPANGAANGLHPEQLLRPDGTPLASVHALAHPSQLGRLTVASPLAASRAAVVGDPTLDRLLESVPRRDRYRRALGTGRRRLVVAVSTWGGESLLERRPGLPLRLATELPYDTYQTALVVHPNEHASKRGFGLAQDLTPERRAGMLLPRPYEEWAALLVAADCVVSDHGSTALYAAALGRPVLSAYDGGTELLPGTPMARLLGAAPRLDDRLPYEPQLARALTAHRAETSRALTEDVFARRGDALQELRRHFYALLGLAPPGVPAEPEPLPSPREVATRCPAPAAFAVDAEVDGNTVQVVRRPASDRFGQYLAAEEDWAGMRHVQSAGLLYRHADGSEPLRVADWSAGVLAAYPACRTVAAVLDADLCVLRVRGGEPLTLRIEPPGTGLDPVAVLCGVHAWLVKSGGAGNGSRTRVRCRVGGQSVTAVLTPGTDASARG